MSKEEFLREVEKTSGTKPGISEGDYKLIEYVYNFHPCISEVEGKRQIAALYSQFGLTLIKDMLPRATEMEHLETELLKAKRQVEELTAQIEDVRAGHTIKSA